MARRHALAQPVVRTTLAGLATLLAAAVEHAERHQHERLEKAAKLVETEAKAEIVTYQAPAGHRAGCKVADELSRPSAGFSVETVTLRYAQFQRIVVH